MPGISLAQEEETEEEISEAQQAFEQASITVNVSGGTQTFVGQNISFDTNGSSLPEPLIIQETLWNFGDGVRTTGEKVAHVYERPGLYPVTLTITTDQGVLEHSIDVEVFEHVMVLVADGTASEEELQVKKQQAAREGMLLLILRARSGGPEVVVEEELTEQMIDARDAIGKAQLIATWTSGSVGSSVLSKFAQHIRRAEEVTFNELNISAKGFVILSDTPFGVLAPTAQAAYDQLRPSYILLTKPQGLDVLLTPLTPEEAREAILTSPISHRLLGLFSARTVQDIGVFNFMSFAINYLVNRGVPINSITLVLMLPVIATILSLSRQIIGIKAFGLVTPAMTTLSFLVMGLEYGLLVFMAILIAGTATRLVLRTFHLLYLPRMALVLTVVSLAILGLFGLGAVMGTRTLASFSIFPILILTLLAEEFIALQFQSGAKRAFVVTAWTLLLSIAGYFIVSWELLRTVILSYPEVVLLAIPINILIGRWSGLRLTEYFRFRKLLRYTG